MYTHKKTAIIRLSVFSWTWTDKDPELNLIFLDLSALDLLTLWWNARGKRLCYYQQKLGSLQFRLEILKIRTQPKCIIYQLMHN